ncbi:hypothetical protein ACHAPJ_013586 [Fusarium lateritium]
MANGVNHVLSISGNLHAALRALRRSDVHRLIWADAICINQNDVEERSQQVRLMGKIFSGACQVIVWLGEEGDRCDCGQSILETSLSSVSKALSGVCSIVNDWLVQNGEEKIKATYYEALTDGRSVLHHTEPKSGSKPGFRGEAPQEETRVTDIFVLKLFKRHWFSRIWVIQESVLAKRVIVQFGSYQISWEWIGIAAAIIVHSPVLTANDLYREKTPTGATNAYLMYRLSASQSCFQPLRFDFAQLLQVTRQFNSKEERDKIYGLIGLQTTDSITERIIPDYRKETKTEKIYEDVAWLLLGSKSPLTFLTAAGTFGSPGFSGPSWVPSWHKPRSWTMIPSNRHPRFQCALGAPMRIDRTGETKHLLLQGVIVDRIRTLNGVPYFRHLLLPSGTSEECFFSKGRWSESDWQKCALTLSCGGEGRGYPVDDVVTHLADLAAALLSGKLDWVMCELTELYKVIESEPGEVTQLEYLKELAKTGKASRYVSALAPVLHDYRVFITESNLFGVGPVDMEIGDQLCVLFGAEVPFLLRPKDGYRVIGECYVYDIMHGEILDKLASDPDRPLKSSWIKLI